MYNKAMGKVYVFVNQKGGVGKTTSAINLGASFAEDGKTVLLVDFDSQANLSSGIGINRAIAKPGVYELITGNAKLDEVIRPTIIPGLSVIPSTLDLSGAAVELINEENRNYYLRDALEPVRDKYDFILIDSPPSLGILTTNGLAAADSVLIPMQCEYFAMEGLTHLLQTIRIIKKGVNKKLEIGGIFFTMYDSRTRLSQEVVKEINGYFSDRVYNTIIPRNVRLSEAPSYELPISRYEPLSNGARAYKNLAEEIIKIGR